MTSVILAQFVSPGGATTNGEGVRWSRYSGHCRASASAGWRRSSGARGGACGGAGGACHAHGRRRQILLYSNLDLKEAGQIASQLDQAGIKYDLKGDGSTIMVSRDKVNAARLMLSGKGLPTSGSVGYEIFDSAPALGQTDSSQNLT